MSTTQMDLLLEKMCAGQWCFDLIAPQFRKTLERTAGDEHGYRSLCALTIQHYQPHLSAPKELSISPSGEYPFIMPGTDDASKEAWQGLCSLFLAGSRTQAPAESEIHTWHQAIDIIRKADSEAYAALKAWITHFCVIDGGSFRSASHPHAFGCLFMQLQTDPISLAVSLIHEMAHQELFLINLVDRLIPEGSDYNLIHAPFQGRVRPPIGRLHSAHALYRMFRFERIIVHQATARHKEQLDSTISTFLDGELTPFAWSLTDAMH